MELFLTVHQKNMDANSRFPNNHLFLSDHLLGDLQLKAICLYPRRISPFISFLSRVISWQRFMTAIVPEWRTLTSAKIHSPLLTMANLFEGANSSWDKYISSVVPTTFEKVPAGSSCPQLCSR